MTVELQMLVLATGLTALLWIPYILAHIVRNGPVEALTYRADGVPLPSWAQRAKGAHRNAVENLVLFAPLVLTAHILEVHSATTVLAAQVYFWARVVHVAGYYSNIPLGRTLPFAVGWVATLAFLFELLTTV